MKRANSRLKPQAPLEGDGSRSQAGPAAAPCVPPSRVLPQDLRCPDITSVPSLGGSASGAKFVHEAPPGLRTYLPRGSAALPALPHRPAALLGPAPAFFFFLPFCSTATAAAAGGGCKETDRAKAGGTHELVCRYSKVSCARFRLL